MNLMLPAYLMNQSSHKTT